MSCSRTLTASTSSDAVCRSPRRQCAAPDHDDAGAAQIRGPRFFRPIWSREILDEVQESLERRGIDPAKIEHRINVMEANYPEAMAQDVERFLAAVPDEVESGDRHVVAAALAGRADAIVTNDLDDIPADAVSPLSIEVQSLDAFLLNQLTLDPDAVSDVLAEIEEDLDRPPMTILEILDALEQHAPHFAEAMRAEAAGG